MFPMTSITLVNIEHDRAPHDINKYVKIEYVHLPLTSIYLVKIAYGHVLHDGKSLLK